MSDRVQFIAGAPAEAGVLKQYLDGELHLVDDTLTGWLFVRPQFKVVKRVVKAVAVFMVHVFVLLKRTAKRVFHNQLVFKHLFSTAQVDTAVARRVDKTVRVNWAPTAAFVATFLGAKTLLHVVASVAAIFGATKVALSGLAAQLALERRGALVVHEHFIPGYLDQVKEIV